MFGKSNKGLKKAALSLMLAFNCAAVPAAFATDSTSVAPPAPTPVTAVVDSGPVPAPALAPAAEKKPLPQEGYWAAPQLYATAKIEKLPNGNLRLSVADVSPSEGRPYLYFMITPAIRNSLNSIAARDGRISEQNHTERYVARTQPEKVLSVIGYVVGELQPAGDGKYTGNLRIPGKGTHLKVTMEMIGTDQMSVRACMKVPIAGTQCQTKTWPRTAEPVKKVVPVPLPPGPSL